MEISNEVTITGAHVWNDREHVYLELEIDGKWYKVIKEFVGTIECSFGHIIEPEGIRKAIKTGVPL